MKLNLFRLPTQHEKAQRDLAQAELQLLDAHTMAEHATAMLGYHAQRVARLRALVHAHEQARTVKLPVVDTMKGAAR